MKTGLKKFLKNIKYFNEKKEIFSIFDTDFLS